MLGGAQEQALMWAEQLPVFPGGSEALARALAETIIYPPSCNNTQGKVVVQFVVTETGDIGEVKVVRSIDQMLDSIAIAAVKGLPKFIPGRRMVNQWMCGSHSPSISKLRTRPKLHATMHLVYRSQRAYKSFERLVRERNIWIVLVCIMSNDLLGILEGIRP